MGFILTAVKKTVIRFFICLVPVALFITVFSLWGQGIPVWNIGIRNVLVTARGFFMQIVIASYLIAALLTVALLDKTKVRSVLLLHIPPLVAGILIIGGAYLAQRERRPFPIMKSTLTLGYKVFVREGVFNDLGKRSLLLRTADKRSGYDVFIHDRKTNNLEIFPNLAAGRGRGRSFFVDEAEEAFVVSQGPGRKTVTVPYDEFRGGPVLMRNFLVRAYTDRIRDVRDLIGIHADRLSGRDRRIFFSVLFLSVLVISIPLTFAFNDAGWGFSGITGAIIILAALPYLYWGVFTLVWRTRLRSYMAVGFGYLYPCVLICALGVLIDLLIKMRVTR
jgi:hypothetical protein